MTAEPVCFAERHCTEMTRRVQRMGRPGSYASAFARRAEVRCCTSRGGAKTAPHRWSRCCICCRRVPRRLARRAKSQSAVAGLLWPTRLACRNVAPGRRAIMQMHRRRWRAALFCCARAETVAICVFGSRHLLALQSEHDDEARVACVRRPRAQQPRSRSLAAQRHCRFSVGRHARLHDDQVSVSWAAGSCGAIGPGGRDALCTPRATQHAGQRPAALPLLPHSPID
jgi:hypothetical protein